MTPVALESAAIRAYGQALHDVARAAEAFRKASAGPVGPWSDDLVAARADLEEALDRLTALGWVPGPERVGTALAGSGEALGWQPIETAPRDGTRIIIALYSARSCVWVSEDGWNPDRDEWSDLGGNDGPTHWMALPEPPGSLTGAGDGG